MNKVELLATKATINYSELSWLEKARLKLQIFYYELPEWWQGFWAAVAVWLIWTIVSDLWRWLTYKPGSDDIDRLVYKLRDVANN